MDNINLNLIPRYEFHNPFNNQWFNALPHEQQDALLSEFKFIIPNIYFFNEVYMKYKTINTWENQN
jgi:hypothetical protein